SRPAGGAPGDAVQWQSNGEGEFTVEPITKETRGTDVILHLRPEDHDFLKAWRTREIVRKYSDFVEHPIVMDVEREGEDKTKTVTEERMNGGKAVWGGPKSEIKPEEYEEFYHHIAHDWGKPAKTIHYSAEGAQEFKALLYLPAHKPMDLMFGDSKKGLQLYI